jgi:GcrA cell cycle regulator
MTEVWWTEERVEELKTRFVAGESGSEICRAMHARSRSAVIGKLHRLGLSRLARPPVNGAIRKQKKKKLHLVNHASHFRFEEQTDAMIEDNQNQENRDFKNPKRLLELTERDCRWPGPGAGLALWFCAAPAVDGQPYCGAHCAIAYGAAPRPKLPWRS